MSYDMAGTIKVIMDVQTFDSGFTKREFVITSGDQYPQDIKFECIKDKTAMLDRLEPGQDVTVSFDVRGNEYNGKFYVNLQAWRVKAEQSMFPQQAQPQQSAPHPGVDNGDVLPEQEIGF